MGLRVSRGLCLGGLSGRALKEVMPELKFRDQDEQLGEDVRQSPPGTPEQQVQKP